MIESRDQQVAMDLLDTIAEKMSNAPPEIKKNYIEMRETIKKEPNADKWPQRFHEVLTVISILDLMDHLQRNMRPHIKGEPAIGFMLTAASATRH